MPRFLARFFFIFVLGTFALLLGVVTSMTLTPPGRDLLARTVSRLLDRIVTGSVDVGSISGSFLYDLNLERLVVRDTAGALLADMPRVRVSYRLPNLIAGNVVLSSIEVDRPIIQLIKHRNGRMNYEEVLGIGKGAPGGKSPLVVFYDVRITDGTLRIALPWNPSDRLTTDAQRDSALRAERAKPGRVIERSAEGLRRVLLFEDLTTRMARLRISTPDRQPFTIDLDSLATRVNDPAVTVRHAVGRARIRGDSVVFSLSEVALPDTRASGGGAVTWPNDTILFDFQFGSPHVSLADLRWVSPQFPDFLGSGILTARSVSGAVTEYDIRDLRLTGEGRQAVRGELVAITDKRRPTLGVRDMRLRLENLDLDVARAYLDSLPFYGTLTGTVAGRGWLDDLDVTVDWTFADAMVPGNPVSTIAAEGRVLVTPDSGLVFRGVEVTRSNVDLGTVRRLAPAVILEGRLAAAGRLDGPLRNVTFDGTATHRHDDRPPSVATGRVHLDTRFDTLGLATDVVLDPLSFEGIRAAFPTLRSRGELRGTFRSEGTLADLAVDAELAGELGAVRARGRVTLLPPHWGADDLDLAFSDLNLAALTGRDGLFTRLDGALNVTGSVDTLRAPEGRITLSLDRSRVREFTLDTVFARASIVDSVIGVDTAYAIWRGAEAGGSGTLGWAQPHTGRMAFTFRTDSLVAFDSLLIALAEIERDTADDVVPLGGSAEGRVELAGSLDSLAVDGDVVARDLVFHGIATPAIEAAATWTGGSRPRITASASADTLEVNGIGLSRVAARAAGFADSLDWAGGFGSGEHVRLDASGAWWRAADTMLVRLDSLAGDLASHRWRLAAPATIALADSLRRVSPLRLATTDGSGAIQVEGTVPGAAPGELRFDAVGIDLRDVWGALQRDTTGLVGTFAAAGSLTGTAAAPTLRGTVSFADARFGDFDAPFVEGIVHYADRRLRTDLSLWRTGRNVMQVAARLPVAFSLDGGEMGRIDGPIDIRARTDSVELAIIEALTDAVQRVSGELRGDVQIGGTWDRPRLSGRVAVRDGAMTIPGLGVRYTGIDGGAVLRGDSLVLDELQIRSNGGSLAVTGSVQLENLGRPVLDLAAEARQFHALDVPNFLTLSATGRLQLRGPVFGATLTGSATANEGVLYFADLVSKRIIDLEDPTIADLVDSTLIQRENLGGGIQNRFLDSLRIQNFRLDMGQAFWLRSNEANIQLQGQLTVDKFGQEYVPEGTLTAARGTYTLRIGGVVTRDFTVERGTVRYYGTPDLNPTLDVTARHVVRGARGEQVPVVARITGTLRNPRLSLSTSQELPLTETDLASYLITGYPANEATALGQAGAVQSLLPYLSGAFFSEFERFLVSDVGVPVDILEIRPGISTGLGNNFTRLLAGWQIGRKTFLTVNAGFCDVSEIRARNLGAGLEFRFSSEWRLQASAEPTYQGCFATNLQGLGDTGNYQFGADILWEREY